MNERLVSWSLYNKIFVYLLIKELKLDLESKMKTGK